MALITMGLLLAGCGAGVDPAPEVPDKPEKLIPPPRCGDPALCKAE